jgi:cell division septation protein DedD
VAPREADPPPIVLNQEPVPEPPLFAEPKAGSVYIQMGAVEKGVSVIFAEGLRKRGLPAFVAPGPSEKIFRVLIGPLPDPAAYVKAKDAVDRIGLATFARRFPN